MVIHSASLLALERVLLLLCNLHLAASIRSDGGATESEKPTALSLAEAEAYIGHRLHDAMAQSRLQNSAQRDMNTSSGSDGNMIYKPIMEVDFCVQVDIDMSLQVPGLTLNLGLLGAIEYNFKNDCWGTKLEASVGASFGIKFWGYQLKFSVSWTGFLHTHELPINDIAKMASTSQVIKDFASELSASGVDETRCSTPNPFTVVLTALRHYIHRAVGEASVEDELRKKAAMTLDREERFTIEREAYRKLQTSRPNQGDSWRRNTDAIWYHADVMPLYQHITQGIKRGTNFWKLLVLAPYLEEPPPQLPKLEFEQRLTLKHSKSEDARSSQHNNPLDEFASMDKFLQLTTKRKGTLVAKDFNGTAIAMHRAMRAFVEKLPSYSSQVLKSLIEQDDRVEVAFPWLPEPIQFIVRRLFVPSKSVPQDNSGRFLARYPDNIEEAHKGNYNHRNGDQRVMNIPKVMKNSPNRDTAGFWKEIAISASNLLVRTVGDVQALFAAHFAGDPHWDGSCESLNLTLDVRYMSFVEVAAKFHAAYDNTVQEMLQDYPWASSETLERYSFAMIKDDSQPDKLQQMLADLEHSLSLRMTPRIMFQDAPRSNMNYNPLVRDERLFPLVWCRLAESAGERSPASAETVNDDYDNYHTLANAKEGMVVRVRQACYTTSAQENGGNRSRRFVTRRPECEEAHLPRSFVRIFPRFVDVVQATIWRVEVMLLEMNLCLDEAVGSLLGKLDKNYVLHDNAERSRRQDSCNQNNETLKSKYVQEKASAVVDLVKQFVLHLGGHINLEPETEHKAQKQTVEQLKSNSSDAAPLVGALAAILADDFMQAFGVGVDTDTVHLVGDREDDLSGRMSQHLKAQFKSGRNNLLRVQEGDVFLLGDLWQQTNWNQVSTLFDINPNKTQMLQGRPYRWQEELQLRPWVEYEYGFRLSLTLADAAFCTPPDATANAEYISKTRALTWTNHVQVFSCVWFLWKPGTTAIEYLSCKKKDTSKDDGEVITSFQLKFNILTLAWGVSADGAAIDTVQTLLGTFKEGLHSLIVSGTNLGAMGAVYRMLERQTNNDHQAVSRMRGWMEKIAAFTIPVAAHVAAAGEGGALTRLKEAFADMGALKKQAHPPTEGWQPVSLAHVLIGSYTAVQTYNTAGHLLSQSDTIAWVFVNAVQGTLVVPGASKIQFHAAVVLVWPFKGTRLPNIRAGDVDHI